MSFTVKDFHDLVVIMEEQPIWRAEMRRLVLTDDILGLPQALRDLAQSVRELSELQRRHEEKNEARFTRVESDIHELKTDVSQLKTDVSQLKTDVSGLKTDVSQLKTDVSGLKTSVGRLTGRSLELQVRERIPTYLSRFALRLRPISNADFAELLETAAEAGQISEVQAEDAKLIDAVARGRRRSDGATIYLALEISAVVDGHDLERAIRRAAIITEATNMPTLPVVIGETILAEVRNQAEQLGAGYVVIAQE
jgi:uncharacterized protein YoxC